MGCIPLLDFVEAREERDGNEDDDCFFAMTDFDLKDTSSALPRYVSPSSLNIEP